MTTTPATQAILPVTPEDREAAGQVDPANRVDIKLGRMDGSSTVQAFARHRQAYSLPREVGTVSAVDAFEMGFSFGMSMRGQTLEDSRAVGRLLYSDMFKSIAPQIENAINEQGFDSFQNADSGMCQAKRIIRAALTSSALSGDAGEVWQPIETCPMWAVAVVTDGISVAISQRAEADDGTPYWAIDPEDGLDWEPTYWVPALDEQLPSHKGAE